MLSIALRTILLGLVASVLVWGSGHTAERPDLSAYGRLPLIDFLSMTPSGKAFAVIVRDEGEAAVRVFDAQSLSLTSNVPLPKAKVRNVFWVDDDRLVLVYSRTGEFSTLDGKTREYFMGSELNFKTQKAKPLLTGLERSVNVLGGLPVRATDKAGVTTLIVPGLTFPADQSVISLIKHTESGLESLLTEGALDTTDWAIGPTGAVLGEVRYSKKDGRWKVLVGPGKSELKPVQSGTDLINRPRFAGVSADEATVYVSVPDGEDSRIHAVAVQAGTWGDELTGLRGRSTVKEEGAHVVIGSNKLDGDVRDYEFETAADQALWRAVLRAFTGAKVDLISLSHDRTRLIVKVFGGDFGFGYYIVDRQTGGAKWFGDVHKKVGPKEISERQYVHYAAADGMDIPAYLTLPRDRVAKDLPLIVLPHGGPFARDDIGFDWWSQAYASRGYAVLQPQFRGSDGFGLDHLRAGYGEYGRKMQTDLSDGITDLVKKGLVDAKRVAIVGGSYGGYAALAGVTLQTGVYRCAVSLAGPSNMSKLLLFQSANYGTSRNALIRYWHEYLGAKNDKDPALDTISPEFHAAKASAPILLIHGVDDTVVPIDQSKRMEAALKRAGKPVEMVTLKGEDHWLSTSETRLQMLTASTAFLERCNPPNSGA